MDLQREWVRSEIVNGKMQLYSLVVEQCPSCDKTDVGITGL